MKYKIIEEIKTGGSDRKFFRIILNKKTYILIKDKNIDQYIKILNHLLNAKIAVPKLFEVGKKQAIVEDLGINSLYQIMIRHKKNWQDFYRMALDELVKLQINGYPDAPVNNYYNEEHIKLEQDYFKIYFLQQFFKISEQEIETIDEDFKKLQKHISEGIKPISNFLMHRDYQSQNIFIKDNQIRIVDFQSARIGPLTYDLASLLRDAYVVIDKKTEGELIEYYIKQLIKKGIKIRKDDFLKIYKLTAIQRNMQALGAFANLSLNKKKFWFKKFIPRGLKLLTQGLQNNDFNKLSKLVKKLSKRLNNYSTIKI